jgi:hypothetical protein
MFGQVFVGAEAGDLVYAALSPPSVVVEGEAEVALAVQLEVAALAVGQVASVSEVGTVVAGDEAPLAAAVAAPASVADERVSLVGYCGCQLAHAT